MKKIRCTKAEQLIVTELDEGLARADTERLAAHLPECEACRQFQKETAQLLTSVRGQPCEDPGEAYWQQYHALLDSKLSRIDHSPLPWWKLPALVGAAAMIFLAFGVTSIFKPDLSFNPNGKDTAAVQEVDRLFGVSSDDGLLLEPNFTKLLVGFDSSAAGNELSILSMIDSYNDGDSGLDRALE